MELFIAAFAAGILTVLAPCILPLLPVVLGGSLAVDEHTKKSDAWRKPVTITLSLGVSVILFTLLLKFSTSLLGIPSEVWQVISGGILLLLGLSLAFPEIWERATSQLGIGSKAQSLLGTSARFRGNGRDVATGFALGPVFNSCSPTYLFIVATVLPSSFAKGFALLVTYTLGLCGVLLLIAFLGQSFTAKLSSLSNPSGKFKRILGLVLMSVGVVIIFGLDKSIQTYVLDKGWYVPISRLEMSLE